MKTLNITLQKKSPRLPFSYAVLPQWKPWEQEQLVKSSFPIEDFIADFFNRRRNKPRRHEEV